MAVRLVGLEPTWPWPGQLKCPMSTVPSQSLEGCAVSSYLFFFLLPLRGLTGVGVGTLLAFSFWVVLDVLVIVFLDLPVVFLILVHEEVGGVSV